MKTLSDRWALILVIPLLGGCGIGLCANGCHGVGAAEITAFAIRSDKPLERVTLNRNIPTTENLALAIESGPIVTGASMGLVPVNGVIATSGTIGVTQTTLATVVTDPDGDGQIGIPLIDPNETYTASLSLEFEPGVDPTALSCEFEAPYESFPCSPAETMSFDTSLITSTADLKVRVRGATTSTTNATIAAVNSLPTRRVEVRQLGPGGTMPVSGSLALPDSSYLFPAGDLYRYYPTTGRLTAVGMLDAYFITEFSSGIYFIADPGGAYNLKLFRYDPSGDGHIHQISNIRPGTSDFALLDSLLCEVGPYLLIRSFDGAGRSALFAYHATLGTIQQVADTNAGQDDEPDNCTVINGTAYLTSSVINSNRRELFSFQPAGPVLTQLSSLSTGTISGVSWLDSYGTRIYMRTDIATGAADLAKYFVYDISAGTITRMTNTSTVAGSTDAINYRVATDRDLYFYAYDASGFAKLHRHNFATQTTHQITNLNPGGFDWSSTPTLVAYENGILFGGRNSVGSKWYFFDPDAGPLGTVYQLSNRNPTGNDSPDDGLTSVSGKALSDRWLVGISDLTTRSLFAFDRGTSWSHTFFSRMGKLSSSSSDLFTCCSGLTFYPHTSGLSGSFAWDSANSSSAQTAYSIDFVF